MRYHQGRLIRKHQEFNRNCTICGVAVLALISVLALAA